MYVTERLKTIGMATNARPRPGVVELTQQVADAIGMFSDKTPSIVLGEAENSVELIYERPGSWGNHSTFIHIQVSENGIETDNSTRLD